MTRQAGRTGKPRAPWTIVTTITMVALTCLQQPNAADHADSPSVSATDPLSRAVDLLDLYGWVNSSSTQLNLIMTVFRDASPAARFSDAAEYLFHIRNHADVGGGYDDYRVLCTFNALAQQSVACTFNAPDNTSIQATGLINVDLDQVAGLRVFAGLRDDPFFFNADGFEATVAAVKAAAPSLVSDATGCPDLTDGTADALVQCLSTACNNGPGGINQAASNRFAGQSVLAIVVQIPVANVTLLGSMLDVWASTRALDQQLDRVGRPAISTALLGSFSATDSGALKDAYNQDEDRDTWVVSFADDIKASLAILDALDSTVDGP